MSHRVEWKEKLEPRFNKATCEIEMCRVVYCYWKDTYYEVIREFEKNYEQSNLIEYVNICGYLFTPPGEERSEYYRKGWKVQEQWEEHENKKFMLTPWSYIDEENLEESKKKIIEFDPESKYLVAKYKGNQIKELFNLYFVWKKYKIKTETLVELGYHGIALNSRVYKLSGTITRELFKKLKNGKFSPNIKLNNAIACIKYGIEECELPTVYAIGKLTGAVAKIDIELYRYALKIGMDKNYQLQSWYEDYWKMLKENNNHDLTDPYWRFPKDIKEAHEKVLGERKALEETKKEKETEKNSNGLAHAYSILKVLNTKVGDYDIYFPENFIDWKIQAEKLHQCIIYANYYKRVIEGTTLIAFIKTGNTPVATIEFDFNKKIRQFYADERAQNIKPSEEVDAITREWINQIPMELLNQTKKLKRVAN